MRIAGLFIAGFVSFAVPTAATANWVVKQAGGTRWVVGSAQAGTWKVNISCYRKSILGVTLVIRPPRDGYLGHPYKVILRVGAQTFPVETDGSGDYGVEVHSGGEGMPRAFLNLLLKEKSLVLEGTSFEKAPLSRRTFPLAKAADVLGAVSADCSALR